MAKKKKEIKKIDNVEKIRGNIVEKNGKITFENPPTEFNPGTMKHEPKIASEVKEKTQSKKEEKSEKESQKKNNEEEKPKRKNWVLILIALILIALLVVYFWLY